MVLSTGTSSHHAGLATYRGRPQVRAEVMISSRKIFCWKQRGNIRIKCAIGVGAHAAQVGTERRQSILHPQVQWIAVQPTSQRPRQIRERLGDRKRQESGHWQNRQREHSSCIGAPIGVGNRDVRNSDKAGADGEGKAESANDQVWLDLFDQQEISSHVAAQSGGIIDRAAVRQRLQELLAADALEWQCLSGFIFQNPLIA